MKFLLQALVVALSITSAGLAANADDGRGGNDHRGGRQMARAPMGHGRYYEGQAYHGHRLHRYHGRWGYYQPRNGVNVFINIPL